MERFNPIRRFAAVVLATFALVMSGCGGANSSDTANPSAGVMPSAMLPIRTFSLGGAISGMNAGSTLVLQNNGKDDLTVASNGSFVFSSPLPTGASYAITVRVQPTGQMCTVANDSGTMGAVNLTSAAISCVAAPADCKNCFTKKFIYFGENFTQANLDADANFKKLSDLIPRAAAAGYNAIALNAGGSGSYDFMLLKPSAYYYNNFAAIVKKAQDAGIELIPVGAHPSGIAMIDPSLIEAVPVNDTPFLVSGTSARAVGTQILTNSEFDNGLTGWFVDTSSVSLDTSVTHGAGGAIKFDEAAQRRITTPYKLSRLMRKITGVTPHKAYRLSFWIKTSNYDSQLKVYVFDKTVTSPLFMNFRDTLGWGTVAGGGWAPKTNSVAPTQDWTQYNLDFNTGNFDAMNLYIGAWDVGAADGTAWIDDIKITEIGLAHTVQRSSLPVSVKSADGATSYQVDTDYVIGAEELTIPSGSKILNGSTVKVSWYQSAKFMEGRYSTPASACSKRYFDLTTDIVKKTDVLLNHPKGYFMYYDEWRFMNWDPLCGAITAGTYLKNTTQAVQNILLSVNPKYDLYIWNDMFDPYQNALDVYWMVNGSLTGSWEGLNPKTIVMNWNTLGGTHQVDSLKFFSGRGHKQMLAVYYDDPTLASTKAWLDHLKEAEAAGVTGVNGFMFTTWRNNYDDLEKVADFIKTNYPQYWR